MPAGKGLARFSSALFTIVFTGTVFQTKEQIDMEQILNSSAIVDDSNHAARPLCVDLDGTLIHSDLLIESALALVAANPLMVFAMLAWLARGKAHLKQEIARRVNLSAASLPYNEPLLAWLRELKGTRPLILCTASDIALARRVADHLQLFDEVIASNGTLNLSGSRKAATLVQRFGEKGFDYAGNASVDLKVWKHSHHAIVTGYRQGLSSAAAAHASVEREFIVKCGGIRTWAKALRIHQWAKNILVFLPLLASHRLLETSATLDSLLAFLCFGLCASSVYVTNDLLDLESDRKHHRKRHRPFASGALPLHAGLIATVVLLVVSFVLSWFVSPTFSLVLAGYYLLTTAYSLRLKRIMMLDVVALAMLYTTRIIAGSAAIHSKASFWILAFSMFMFLSLAMVKRYVELLTLQHSGQVKTSGRGYDVDDIPLIQSLGGSSGYLAVLVLALYIDSTTSEAMYHHPHRLWLLCPLLLYWISRTWAVAHRGAMHDDPVVFAMKDNASRLLMLAATVVVVTAIL